MYDFHYNTIKTKYDNRAKLLMTDTDSLMYEIQTQDFYEDMKEFSNQLDTSEYPQGHHLYSPVNKKVIGKFKDETSAVPITEFVGLRSKMYAFKVDNKDKKRAKGIKKCVIKKELKLEDYKRSLFGNIKEDIQQMTSFNTIRSYNHQLYSITTNKVGIASTDDKRFVLSDSVNTYAYGHKNIKCKN